METIRQVFSFNLRHLRGTRTQAEMAELLGLPLRSYQRLDSGEMLPQESTLQHICAKLRVSEVSLFQSGLLSGAQDLNEPDHIQDSNRRDNANYHPEKPLNHSGTRRDADGKNRKVLNEVPKEMSHPLSSAPSPADLNRESLLGQAVTILAGLDEAELRAVLPFIQGARAMTPQSAGPSQRKKLADDKG